MKTVNIKGKEYVRVNERIKYFREHYKDYRLTTEIHELNEKYCVMKAYVISPDGNVLATGFAREVNGDNYINKTSYVENCETSAWGRALGNFGIGIDAEIASADEVINAVNNKDKKPKTNTPPKPTAQQQKNIDSVVFAIETDFNCSIDSEKFARDYYNKHKDYPPNEPEKFVAIFQKQPDALKRYQAGETA